MKTHVALFTTLMAGVIAIGSEAVLADDDASGKVVISTPLAPAVIGPYSQAIRVGRTLYISGQIAIDPTTNTFNSSASIEDQTSRVLGNIAGVLTAAGMRLTDVVNTTVYMKDLNDFAKMNQVYATFFKNSPPARATLEAARIPRDAKVEISAIAVAGEHD